MVSGRTQDYRAKIFNMGGAIRGWIPTPLAREMNARDGDYMVFRLDAAGKVTATIRRPTASEKKRAKTRKTKDK